MNDTKEMRYKKKACEIVGEKEVFGQRIAWIRLMEDGSFHEVPYDELEKPSTENSNWMGRRK